MQTPHSILKQYWQYGQFRPLQEDIINHVLSGNDTLAILPTGGGKSICYQVPAMVMEGTCLVVSPLIALMKDQALGLQNRGIPSLVVFSGMSRDEVEIVYRKNSTGDYKFLFVSPERLKSAQFLDYLDDWNINLLAIDEAHCISQWGYDFRPPYLEISALRERLNHVPCLALTASATPFVQKDIIEKLAFANHQVFFSTFLRDNISFSVFEVENKIVKSIDILNKVKGSSIVYCKNRRRTKELAEILCAQGISADYYHAGLKQELRSQKQDDWINNKVQTIVCTNAFGMGIDKPDVRVVIHYDMPDMPEAFYQEAGRAGRDGKKSYAVLLYQQKDIDALKEGVLQKYPSSETIRTIYDAICSYLKIGYGNGMNEQFDFELVDFCGTHKLNLIESMSTIKLLEQQNFWYISEGVSIPSRVSVIGTKTYIEQIEKQHPDLDEILKVLLRMYGGLWNHFVPISEFKMAQKVLLSKDYIEFILQKLHDLHVIEYVKYSDKPQLFFQHNRIEKRFLEFDVSLMKTLKEQYEVRLKFMISWVQNKTQCRSTSLISYFGEQLETSCGQCDNCLLLKKEYTTVDFDSIKNTILHELTLKPSLEIKEFSSRFNSHKQESLMNTIRFLLEDKQLKLNPAGDIIKA